MQSRFWVYTQKNLKQVLQVIFIPLYSIIAVAKR